MRGADKTITHNSRLPTAVSETSPSHHLPADPQTTFGLCSSAHASASARRRYLVHAPRHGAQHPKAGASPTPTTRSRPSHDNRSAHEPRAARRPVARADPLRAPTCSVRRPAPCADPLRAPTRLLRRLTQRQPTTARRPTDPTPTRCCEPAHFAHRLRASRSARRIRLHADPLSTSARRRALVPDLPTGRRTARSALRQQRRACFPGGGCVIRSSSVHLGHAQIVHACCGWQWEHTRSKETELCRLDARASSQRLTESWPNMCSTSTRIGDASVESMLADKLVQIIASEELRVSTHSADKRSACRVHHQHALS